MNKKSWLARHGTEEDWKEIQEWRASLKRNKRRANREKRRNSKRKERLEKYEKIKAERERSEVRCLYYLNNFWTQFNKAATDGERLFLLKRAANPGWGRVTEGLRLYLRKKFEQSKWRLLNIDIEKCGTCARKPREKHHIVPLSYGGINANDNLIAICEGCHDAIHPWMREG